MEYQDVALIDSNYTLMLFCLLYPGKVDSTLFIVSSGVTKNVHSKLNNCLYLPDSNYQNFKKIREIFRNLRLMFSLTVYQLRKTKNIHFYGQDHAWYSFIGRNKPFTLLEDGLDNYVRAPSTGIKRKLLSYFGIPYLEMGRSLNISDIQLTGILPIPEDIKDKVTILDIKKIWEKLDQKEKDFISHLYIAKEQLCQITNLQCENAALILTQPLNQDGIISEDDKTNSYYKAVMSCGLTEVYVKKHPRDTTSYSKYGWLDLGFSNTPIELLLLMGLNFKKVITYNSTAIYRFPASNRVVIKNNFDFELKKNKEEF